jgi:hypothetical protein
MVLTLKETENRFRQGTHGWNGGMARPAGIGWDAAGLLILVGYVRDERKVRARRFFTLVTGSYRQLLAVTDSYRQLPTVTGSYRQLLAVTGSYRQLPAVTARIIGNFKSPASVFYRDVQNRSITCTVSYAVLHNRMRRVASRRKSSI